MICFDVSPFADCGGYVIHAPFMLFELGKRFWLGDTTNPELINSDLRTYFKAVMACDVPPHTRVQVDHTHKTVSFLRSRRPTQTRFVVDYSCIPLGV